MTRAKCEIAYSPGSSEHEDDRRRTPRFPHAEGSQERRSETTFSPISIVGEGLDESARAALESVRRVLTPDHRGDHEDEADAIAERGAFQVKIEELGDDEREYRMPVL